MTLWLDVEDLFQYAARNPRPSGIQRLSFEIYAELQALLGDGVRFVRHDPDAQTLRTVPWGAVRDLFVALHTSPEPDRSPLDAIYSLPMPEELARRGLRRLAPYLPLAIREPVAETVAAQRRAFAVQRHAIAVQVSVLHYGSRAVRAAAGLLWPRLGEKPPAAARLPAWPGADIRDEAHPRDVFAVLGSPWFRTDYAEFVGAVTWKRGLRTAILVYDLIPLVRPEWCDRDLVRLFGNWYAANVPHADVLLAISKATAREVELWSVRTGIAASMPVRVLPIGTGFSGAPTAVGTLPAGLAPGSYALFVSTVEARKNHLLAFRVWRRMVEEMGPAAVPTLVLAGRIGWLVSDLMQQLANCSWLGGKVMMVADPTDEELTALYRNCRFTLFPSLYEGWGLPVTESLAFGKVCVASDRTSIPEAGGPFCLYVDPENVTAATEVIRQACTDDALIREMEARIAAGFRPTPWRDTAEALITVLGIAIPTTLGNVSCPGIIEGP